MSVVLLIGLLLSCPCRLRISIGNESVSSHNANPRLSPPTVEMDAGLMSESPEPMSESELLEWGPIISLEFRQVPRSLVFKAPRDRIPLNVPWQGCSRTIVSQPCKSHCHTSYMIGERDPGLALAQFRLARTASGRMRTRMKRIRGTS
jgi:hypothetical protein